MSDDRTPVLVGVGQLVQRDVNLKDAPSTLDMLDAVARTAAEDAGIRTRLKLNLGLPDIAFHAATSVAFVPFDIPVVLASTRPTLPWALCP